MKNWTVLFSKKCKRSLSLCCRSTTLWQKASKSSSTRMNYSGFLARLSTRSNYWRWASWRHQGRRWRRLWTSSMPSLFAWVTCLWFKSKCRGFSSLASRLLALAGPRESIQSFNDVSTCWRLPSLQRNGSRISSWYGQKRMLRCSTSRIRSVMRLP